MGLVYIATTVVVNVIWVLYIATTVVVNVIWVLCIYCYYCCSECDMGLVYILLLLL